MPFKANRKVTTDHNKSWIQMKCHYQQLNFLLFFQEIISFYKPLENEDFHLQLH